MHDLAVIVYRNERAAGRELAHRVNDGEDPSLIEQRPDWLTEGPQWAAFVDGWLAGRRDG